MIVCVCNALGEAACRRAAGRPECRTVGCIYRRLGVRVRCGRCLPHMAALYAEERGQTAGAVGGSATAAGPGSAA